MYFELESCLRFSLFSVIGTKDVTMALNSKIYEQDP